MANTQFSISCRVEGWVKPKPMSHRVRIARETFWSQVNHSNHIASTESYAINDADDDDGDCLLLQVQHLKEFIPQAFSNGGDLVLDCEILLVDKNGRLLPFGTLGVHKVCVVRRPFSVELFTGSSPRFTEWRGSVVRTSVCSWRTFPDLRLICGWRVTTSWVRCPLWVNQPGQLSLPSLWGR